MTISARQIIVALIFLPIVSYLMYASVYTLIYGITANPSLVSISGYIGLMFMGIGVIGGIVCLWSENPKINLRRKSKLPKARIVND